jgi:SEC-C motif domain protein
LHQGSPAATPEKLMRSRYSAYVKNLQNYLRYSWHPSTCPLDLSADADCTWLGLTIVSACIAPDDCTGRVEFIARYRIKGGSAVRLREQSEFVRFAGRWVYLRACIDIDLKGTDVQHR